MCASDWPKKITRASGWILVPQSLDGLHIMIINGIIIIHLLEWIQFSFDSALNRIEFSIRLTFFSYIWRIKQV